jgi:hypothetical protein
MTLYETDSDGRRIATSYPTGYFQLILDFAAGTLDPASRVRNPNRLRGVGQAVQEHR